MPVEEQVVSIFAGTNGYLDDIAVADVRRFETELLDYIRTRHADLIERRSAIDRQALARRRATLDDRRSTRASKARGSQRRAARRATAS